jgi:epoxyqueuosine reductase
MNPAQASEYIKNLARESGFLLCGIAKAEKLSVEANRLENWLNKGFHGKMKYLENHFDLRTDPTKLVPGAKSVISFLYNYFPEKQQNQDSYQIAKYAYGKDYHFVIKEKLNKIVEKAQQSLGKFDFRVFVDSGPVLERQWAEKAGLGWIGKHGLLISPKKGSYFFLAEIICDLALEYDPPFPTDHCGTCTACIDACPTDAILPDKTLNANHCISYLTIELKDEIPSEYKGKMKDYVFGCDICQDVCPWNRFSQPHNEPAFCPHPNLLEMSKASWKELTQETFSDLFKKSAVKRAGFIKLKKSIDFQK